MPQPHNPNRPEPPRALLISSDVLAALLPAAATFYKMALESRRNNYSWALSEHELIALSIAIDTAAREMGVQDDPLYKDIVRKM